MTVTPVKVILFLLGGTVAAGATAYVAGVFDPIFSRQPAVSQDAPAGTGTDKVAATPPATTSEEPAGQPVAGKTDRAAASASADGATEGEPATDAPDQQAGANAPASGDTAGQGGAEGTSVSEPEQQISALSAPDASSPSPDAPPPVVAPTFDVVRVEPNGSIVIAGQAAPGASVEAVIGSRVIGTATADATGAFAIVLDEPLKPGNYQIVLRSRTADNVVATSIETAIVSIPETLDGQVLALVEEPGKPAEFITVPKPVKPAETIEAVDAAGQKAPTPAEPAAKPEEQATKQSDQAAPGPTEGEQPAQETAAAEPKPAPDAGKSTATPRVAVEAIEIEGNRIFIAGAAEPRRLVRAYANDDFLGEAMSSTAGRFLVEAERDLPVGDYIVRVDVLEISGAKVIARAAVPFEREPGENMAAVAPGAGAPTDGTPEKGDRLQGAEAAQSDGAGVQAKPEAEVAQGAGKAAQSPDKVAAGTDGASSQAGAETGAAVAAAPSDERLSPKLQNVDSAVIIRRGDTLWRISRRVYGRGIRYSTIYLANQDQIQNPHLILPGQVFKVPERTEQGEPADLTQMGDQAIKPPVQQ